uniref:Adenovirus fiber protein n=1 Tax=Rhinolophus ferrumequinum adenovirus TaxID=3140013 RepID=A0AAU6S548_9ADEN
MKRAASFNPVYPFDEQVPPTTTLPPFFSSDGLEEQPGGVLGLKITNPLGFDTDGRLKLKLSDDFSVDVNGALQTSLSLSASAPLELQDNTISLKYGDDIYVDGDGKLQIAKQQSLTAQEPLTIENDTLSLQTGAGLTTREGQLKLAIDQSLYFTNNNNLAVSHYTMWTGTSNEPNVRIRSPTGENNAIVNLILNKCGNVVNGMVRISGVKPPLLEVDSVSAPVVLTLQFFEDGIFNAGISELKGPFGFKVGNEVVNNASFNPILMMPNAHFYPRHSGTLASDLRVYDAQKVIVDPERDTGWQFYYRVEYNVDVPVNGFSIKFTWFKFDNLTAIGLKSSWCYFSYLTHK